MKYNTSRKIATIGVILFISLPFVEAFTGPCPKCGKDVFSSHCYRCECGYYDNIPNVGNCTSDDSAVQIFKEDLFRALKYLNNAGFIVRDFDIDDVSIISQEAYQYTSELENSIKQHKISKDQKNAILCALALRLRDFGCGFFGGYDFVEKTNYYYVCPLEDSIYIIPDNNQSPQEIKGEINCAIKSLADAQLLLDCLMFYSTPYPSETTGVYLYN